ncbi:hypothetical protein U3C50_004611 [Providencia rettgeri]|nr:hypothetical protein [Providencia rettgeri]EMB3084763.1 hypothetical protein [Providencia rettgeri]MDU7496103.1 hypothetical protein [Providencia rettgeri]HEM8308229.1 hypothetical protein [Providencia rettgeri]
MKKNVLALCAAVTLFVFSTTSSFAAGWVLVKSSKAGKMTLCTYYNPKTIQSKSVYVKGKNCPGYM